MLEFTADDIFRLDPRIRWVGLVEEEGNVLFSGIRPGRDTESAVDLKEFMRLNPLLIIGASERLTKLTGEVDTVTVACKEETMHLLRSNRRIMVVSVKNQGKLSLDGQEPTGKLLTSLKELMASRDGRPRVLPSNVGDIKQ